MIFEFHCDELGENRYGMLKLSRKSTKSPDFSLFSSKIQDEMDLTFCSPSQQEK
jgi:hypothetical protein